VTCDGELCHVSATIDDLTLVVTLPESSFFAGQTFVVKYSDLLKTGPSVLKCPQKANCVKLPPLGQIAGSYAVDANTAVKIVKFSVGSEHVRHSIPVDASYRPAWLFGAGSPVEAGLLGLDLQPMFAAPTRGDQDGYYPGPGLPTESAPALAPSVGFDTPLPDGAYEQTLLPSPPFDRAFPPVISFLTISNTGPLRKLQTTDFTNIVFPDTAPAPIVPNPVAVSRAGPLFVDGVGSLEGWTLFIRDDRTQRRLSSIATLHEAAKVNVFTVGLFEGGSAGDAELVLAPPAGGPKLPELVTAVSAAVPPAVSYPLLPPLVTVRGFVLAADGTHVPSEIVVEATKLVGLDEDGAAKDLRFVDRFRTTPEGRYERLLPPGTYKAILTPITSSLADPLAANAKTITDLDVTAPQQPDDPLLVQDGKTLLIGKTVNLTGHCTATDGRVLADAEVEVHPAAALRYATDFQDRDPLRWPRVRTVRTNPSGDFSLPVDPQMTYDVVVRPAAGTRFPWRVVPQVTAPATAALQIEVAAPLHYSVVLHDPYDNKAAHALVRAYRGRPPPGPANPKVCTNNGDCACADCAGRVCEDGHCANPRVAVEIGRTRTDENGVLELYLDSRP
jgi:hypothetical protein